MTCKDCKYFNKINHPKNGDREYCLCEKSVTKDFREYRTANEEICDMFVDREKTFTDK